jgi:hypothetical protein
MKVIRAESQAGHRRWVRFFAAFLAPLFALGACYTLVSAKNVSTPPLLVRAIHNNDTVGTIGYTTTESDLLSKKGGSVSSRVDIVDVGFEDEANNRETHHTTDTFRLFTSGKLTSRKTFALDVVFVGGRVYSRTSADRKWRTHPGTTFADPLTGEGFARKRTTLTLYLRSNFSQQGAASSGQVRFHGTPSLGLIIDPAFRKMSVDVFTSIGSHPYVTRVTGKGVRVVRKVTVQSTLSFDFTSFNQKRVISVPH